MLYCALSQRCAENGRSALIVSLADGSEIQQMDRNRRNAISVFLETLHLGRSFISTRYLPTAVELSSASMKSRSCDFIDRTAQLLLFSTIPAIATTDIPFRLSFQQVGATHSCGTSHSPRQGQTDLLCGMPRMAVISRLWSCPKVIP